MIASSDTAVQLLQSLEAFYMSQKCFNIIFSTGLRLVHESIIETFVKRFGFLPAYHYSKWYGKDPDNFSFPESFSL